MGKIFEFTAKLLTERKHSKIWHRISTLIACLVVFATTYSMILPALTFDEVTASEEPGFDMGAAENEQEAVPVEDVSQNEYYEEEPIQNDSNYTEDYTVSTGSADSGELIVEEEPAAVPAADTTNVYDDTVPAEETGFAPEGDGEVVDFSDTEEPETVLTYEDAEVRITASFEDPAYEAPAGLTLKVAPIAYESEQYNALNDGANERLTEIGNYVISYSAYYDIWFELNNETVIPALNVKLEAQYKNRDLGETGVKLFSYNYDGNAITLHDDVTWGVYDDSDPTWPWRSSFTFRTHGGDVTGHTIAGLLNTEVVEKETAEGEAEVFEEETAAPEENAEPETTIEETATEETVPEETQLAEEAVIESDEFLEEDEYELANEDIIPVEETEDELTETEAVGAEADDETAEAEAATADDEAATDETSEEASASLYKVGQIVYDGPDYTVELNVPEEAHIPSDAELKVDEIDPESEEYKAYYDQAMAAINEEGRELEAGFARFFDIRFEKAGVEIEPNPLARIDVKINFTKTVEQQNETENVQAGEVSAVHFAEKGIEEVEVETEAQGEAANVAEITFETSSFSVFGFVYTVDFETVDGGLFSVPGGGSYALADILEMLGYNITNENIANAEFSNPAVVTITVENGIWMLNSIAPFTTEEVLTVTTVDGIIYKIKVTDAIEGYDGVTYGDLADLSNLITVAVNGTNLNNQQNREKTYNLTFNYSMLFSNAAAAMQYKTHGTPPQPSTYNWAYDLSGMVEDYDEIESFPNMSGTLRNGRQVLGTYEVKDGVVYLHVYESAIGPHATRINGSFTINMHVDEDGTRDSSTFNFPGDASFTVKYKPVEYKPGNKTAEQSAPVVYPSDLVDGYYYVNYTSTLPAQDYDLVKLQFNDVMDAGQEVVTSSVRVNGVAVSSSDITTSSANGQSSFSFNVLNALGTDKIAKNTETVVTYTVRIPAEKLGNIPESGLPLKNFSDWYVDEHKIDGGETEIVVTTGDYVNPTKSLENSSQAGNKVVPPQGSTDGGTVTVDSTMLNDDGTYHIAYKIGINEPAVPGNMSLEDTYGDNQTLLTGTFKVNGQTIPSSYITYSGGKFNIPDVKAAVKAATGNDFAANTQYDITYETSTTAAHFNEAINNTVKLVIENKDYPGNDTTIKLEASDFQPGTKSGSPKYTVLANATDPQSTDWTITLTEPKDANEKALLTDTFDSTYSDVDKESFWLNIDGTDYKVDASYIQVNGSTFTFDLNAYLASNSSIDHDYLKGGKRYTLKYKTNTKTADVAAAITADQNSNEKKLENTAKWTLSDGTETDVDGGKDDVTYTIPDYKDTTKTDTVSGNVNPAYGRYGDATYAITGDGPYTINYTITVPGQDMDMTKVLLTDTYSDNQTLKNDFVLTIAGETITIPSDAINTTTNPFTLDVLAAYRAAKGDNSLNLPKNSTIKLTYSTETSAIDEDITNISHWNFDSIAGEHEDEKDTKEKITKPDYVPGSKSVKNDNAGIELEDISADTKYPFEWTMTITEPVELTSAVLHDYYGTDTKAHDLVVDANHPITITAGSQSVTITSLPANGITVDDANKKLDIDMITVFGVTKFDANTTFTVKLSTETTGDTVPLKGTYQNEANWDFNGTIGPTDSDKPVDGGEAETELKTKEYNDGNKTAWYEGNQLWGGQFNADGSPVIDYRAPIIQTAPVHTLTYTDEWNNNKVKLKYPVKIVDSNGNTIAEYGSAAAMTAAGHTVTDTGFVLNIVHKEGEGDNAKGVLINGSDFVPGVTYEVQYSLDFSELADENGDFGGISIRNTGHWHTTGTLPDHDDDHPHEDEPKSPDWKNPTKSVTDVEYSRSEEPTVERGSIDKGSNDTWFVDNYSTEGGTNGTFYITYSIDITEPRQLSSFVIHDTTNIPFTGSDLSGSAVTPLAVLTITDANGNPVTWGSLLGTANDTVVEGLNDIALTKVNKDGNLGFDWDVISYLNGKKPAESGTITIPKNYKFNLTFTAALESELETATYSRLNTLLKNTIYATVNNHDTETDDADVTIKTRKALTKTVEEVVDESTLNNINGEDLGLIEDQEKTVKYTIVVGSSGDEFTEDYTITDTMTNWWVQQLDRSRGVVGTDGDGGVIEAQPVYSEDSNIVADPRAITGFTYTIPGTTENPIKGPVTLVYYVHIATQTEADALNETYRTNYHWNQMGGIYGQMTETNTAKSPEDKEVTTIYDVEYTAGHDLSKSFTKWDNDRGIAYWKVEVNSVTGIYPAGYKITEDNFKYMSTEPSGENQTWTAEDVANASSMTLDLSSAIVMFGTTKLNAGVDYEIRGNNIVLLKAQQDQDKRATLKVSNIKTTIPGWGGTVTGTQYYYNQATWRSGNDTPLDTDDDQNNTDAKAIIEKKLIAHSQSDESYNNRVTFTWQIVINPPKSGIKDWVLYDGLWKSTYYDQSGRKVTCVTGEGGTYSDGLNIIEDTVELYIGNTKLVKGDDYSNDLYNGIRFNKAFTEPITLTFKTVPNDANNSDSAIRSANSYSAFNDATLEDPSQDRNTASARGDFENHDLTVDKTVTGTGDPIEADGTEYPTLVGIGNDEYIYRVEINPEKYTLDGVGSITFTDLLPAGFELVDWDGETSDYTYKIGGDQTFTFRNDEHSIWFKGWLLKKNIENPNGGGTYDAYAGPLNSDELKYCSWDTGNGQIQIYLNAEYSLDEATGRYRITLRNIGSQRWGQNNPVIQYKVRLTDSEKDRLKTLTTGTLQYYENVATATVGSRSGTDSTTVVYQYKDALTKLDVTEYGSVGMNGDDVSAQIGNAATGEINYVVYINNEKNEEGKYSPRTLNGGEPLTLTDTLSTSLELNRSAITVYEATNDTDPLSWTPLSKNDWSVSYNSDTRALVFKVPDSKHLKVFIPTFAEDPTEDITSWINENDPNQGIHVDPYVPDGEINEADALANRYFANTVTLVGEGKFEDSTDEKHVVYDAGGNVEWAGGTGFTIDKFDGNNITDQLPGAKFRLYKVADYEMAGSETPSSYVIPDQSEWILLNGEGGEAASLEDGTLTTDANGLLRWVNLDYTIPGTQYPANYTDGSTSEKAGTLTGWDVTDGGTKVVLYAWVEVESEELSQDGYVLGDYSKPHYISLYYTAKTREEVAEELNKNGKLSTVYDSITGYSKNQAVTSTNLSEADQITVELEFAKEQKKALSSYELTAFFDYNIQQANFITVSSSKNGYTWPVPNTKTVSKSVIKLWADNDNADGNRPAAADVRVQLYQNGVKYGDPQPLKDLSMSNKDVQYGYTWEGLPAANSDGEKYKYTVEEILPPDYDGVYVSTQTESLDTFTITNRLNDNTTITATKVWEDDDNTERKRPTSIYYTLYQHADDGSEDRIYEATGVVNPKLGTNSNNFIVSWDNLPAVDNPNDPQVSYEYYVVETKLAGNGKEYLLNDSDSKFYEDTDKNGELNETELQGTPIYSVSVKNEGSIYTVTNTLISSKTGSVKLVKELTGLNGAHSAIDTGNGVTADAKEFDVTLVDSDGFAIKATLDEEHSTETTKVYTYQGLQTTETDMTVFKISEKVSVIINELPLGAYSYKAAEDTTGNMSIPNYTFDASATGGSITTVSVKPSEDTENPAEAKIVNNYIPDKGTISVTKEVKGLPEGTDLTAYRFPIRIYLDDGTEEGNGRQYVQANSSLGEAKYVRYVTPGTTTVISNIPIGKYVVEELVTDSRMPSVTEGATEAETATEEILATYSLITGDSTLNIPNLTVTKDGNVTAKLVNKYDQIGKLKVDKAVNIEGLTPAQIDALKDGTDDEKALYQKIMGITFTVTNMTTGKEVDTFTYADIVSANHEYVLENLPYAYYKVEESNTDIEGGYALDEAVWTVDGATRTTTPVVVQINKDNAEAGIEVAVTNNYSPSNGSLSISKAVSNGDPTGKTFTFEVIFKNEDTTPYEGNLTVVDSTRTEATTVATTSEGKLTVTVSGTGTATISEIPVGTKYEVTEPKTSIPSGWKLVAQDGIVYDDSDKAIQGGDDDTVTVTNEYDATGDATFSGKKSIVNREFKEGDSFTVKVVGTDNAPMPGTTEAGSEYTKTFTLTADDVAGGKTSFDYSLSPDKINYELSDIPEGETSKTFTYTVTESAQSMDGVSAVDSASYTVTVTISDKGDGTLNVETSTNYNALNFTNTFNNSTTAKIEGTKAMKDESTPASTYKFNIAAKDPTTAPLPNDGTKNVTQVTNSEASFAFPDITYPLSLFSATEADDEGVKTLTFTYNVTEDHDGITANAAGDFIDSNHVKYDKNTIEVTVTVTYNTKTGAMSSAVSPAKAALKFTNEQLGSLEIVKNIQKNGVDDTTATGTFYYAVYAEDDVENGEPKTGTTPVRTGLITVGSEDNGTNKATENDLPYGKYYVYELTEEGGTPIVSGANGAVHAIESTIYTVTESGTDATINSTTLVDSPAKVTLNNDVKTTEIHVTKKWNLNGSDTQDPGDDIDKVTFRLIRKSGTDTKEYISNEDGYPVKAESGLKLFEITKSGDTWSTVDIEDLAKYYEVQGTGTEVTYEKYKYYVEEVGVYAGQTEITGWNATYKLATTSEGLSEAVKISAGTTDLSTSAIEEGYVEITNYKNNISLPNTGGRGTLPFKVSGSILLAFSALMYVTSFRRRQQEALARTGGYFEGDAEREARRGGGSRR